MAIVPLCACAATLAFINKSYTIDEPWFLALARHILQDPWHPEQFYFNWFGGLHLWSDMSNYPSINAYPMACALYFTHGIEWATRILFLPVDLVAAAFLYLIGSRFLQRPLWPTLILLATPAFFINMPHLMCEKFQAALGCASIYGLLRGVDDESPGWFWASALLAGTANVVKFSSVFLILIAVIYALERRKSILRIAGYVAIAVFPTFLYFAWGALFRHGRVSSTWHWVDHALHFPWYGWIHRLRSVLAFTGAGGVVTAIWPWRIAGRDRNRLRVAIICLAFSIVLFLPWLDWEPAILFDRVAGIIFCAGALLGIVQLASDFRLQALMCSLIPTFSQTEKGIWMASPRVAGSQLWVPWILSAAFLQFLLYWAVSTRYTLFFLPPLVFGMAAWLEANETELRVETFYKFSFVATLLLSLLLARVDFVYARAQREIAEYMSREYISKGKKVWFTGHWGLQYYMEKAGGEELNLDRGPWSQAHSGDVVLVPKVNSNILRPGRRILSNTRRIDVEEAIPLRLIHNGIRHAGFYASLGGFLPYTISRDPLDEFTIVEIL